MKPVYVATDPHEKAMQRALIQYRNPKNYYLVREALEKAGREDLIGFGKECLIRPPGGNRPMAGRKNRGTPDGKPASAHRKSSRAAGGASGKGAPSQKTDSRKRRSGPSASKKHGAISQKSGSSRRGRR